MSVPMRRWTPLTLACERLGAVLWASVCEMVGEIDGYRPLHMELVISVVKIAVRAVKSGLESGLESG